MLSLVARAITYGTLFVSLVLIYLPGQALKWSGVVAPDRVRSAAGGRHGRRRGGRRNRPLVDSQLHRHRPRHAGSLRSTAPAGRARSVHLRAKPDVLRRQPRARRRRALLRIGLHSSPTSWRSSSSRICSWCSTRSRRSLASLTASTRRTALSGAAVATKALTPAQGSRLWALGARSAWDFGTWRVGSCIPLAIVPPHVPFRPTRQHSVR